MKQYLFQVAKVFIGFMLLFGLCRVIFLVYFYHQLSKEEEYAVLQSLVHALPLDISTACYLLFLPLAILLLNSFLQQKIWLTVLKIYLVFTSAFFILFAIAEIAVYREAHVKIYFNLLSHLQHPDELFHSVRFSLMFTFLFLNGLLLYVMIKALNLAFMHVEQLPNKLSWKKGAGIFISFLILVFGAIVGCRGGFQPIPINEGEVYFSKSQLVNDATVNPLWNIVHSFVENRKALYGNVYAVMPPEQANNITHDLYAAIPDSTTLLFKTNRPNVCIIILESWSADLIESLGGYSDLTPNFENLVKEGYLFTNFRPAGHVSDQGIPAVLSGYPALPIGSVINQPEKQPRLSCINNNLEKEGYHSSFLFGGQLIYGNIKSYIYYTGFDRVTEQKNLPASLPCGRLGIGDSVMLALWSDSLNNAQTPFFSCLFTLSTHSPYDAGTSNTVNWGDMENKYLNSVVYSDRQLGLFFDKIKKQPWYGNTVFMLVADHSHNVPKNYRNDSPEYYHIPFLITGGALKEEYRGKKDARIASQTDIASTLLHQLSIHDSSYRWSKNLFNPYGKNFAFYTFNEGFGFGDENGFVVWNKKDNAQSYCTVQDTTVKSGLLQKGHAVLQNLFADFLLM